MSEVDTVVANLKRALMDGEHFRRLSTIVDLAALRPEQPPFDHAVRTSSMNLAGMAAARQGYDAGRWGALADCPYPMGQDPAQTFLRHAWLAGFSAGRKTPRQPRRPLTHTPVELDV